MATPATVNPFNFYPGRDGLPLQNGYLYFGEPFQDPELQPLQAYWDDANTQPAARPIRTINGYPARNGAPAQVFVAAQYSMRVRDSQGREVFYAPNVTAVDLGGGGLDIITASGGQTVVNLTNAAYTPGSNAIDVSLNGLILISGQDYFETGTTRITMASALSAGDQIRAFARSTFGLTQAVLSDWQAEVFDGDGTASQNFTLTRNPGAVANLDISVAGSTLRPLLDYTLSGQVVTITPAPAAGTDNVLIRYGRSLPQDALRGELASTASAADGDALLGTKRTATDAEAMTQHQRTEMASITLHDFIPASLHAAIILGTNTTDLSSYIQNFLDHLLVNGGAGRIYKADYKCDNPVTLQRSSSSHASDLVIHGSGARFICTSLTGSEIALRVGATSTSFFIEKGSWVINDLAIIGPETTSPLSTDPATTTVGLECYIAGQLTLNNVRAHDFYTGCRTNFCFPLSAIRCNFRDNWIGLHLDEVSNLQTWYEPTLVECRYSLLIRSTATTFDSGKSNNIRIIHPWMEGSLVGWVIDTGAGGAGATRFRDIHIYQQYTSGNTYDIGRAGLQWTLANPQTRNANCSEFLEGLYVQGGLWNPGGGSFTATNAAIAFDSVGRICNAYIDIQVPSEETDADVLVGAPRNSWIRMHGAPGTFGNNVIEYQYDASQSVVRRILPTGEIMVGAKVTTATLGEVGIGLTPAGTEWLTADGTTVARWNRLTSDGSLAIFYKDGASVGSIGVTGAGTSFNVTSDPRLKRDIVAADSAAAFAAVMSWPVRSFTWKATGLREVGFIATELQAVKPDAVTGEPDGMDEVTGGIMPMMIDKTRLLPEMVLALQHIAARVAALEAK